MWEIVMTPQRRGILVQLTDGEKKSVVGRVGYSRLFTKYRLRTFKSSLKRVIKRAEREAFRQNVAEGYITEQEVLVDTYGSEY